MSPNRVECRKDAIHLAWIITNAGGNEQDTITRCMVVSMCSRSTLCATLESSLIRSWRWRITLTYAYRLRLSLDVPCALLITVTLLSRRQKQTYSSHIFRSAVPTVSNSLPHHLRQSNISRERFTRGCLVIRHVEALLRIVIVAVPYMFTDWSIDWLT